MPWVYEIQDIKTDATTSGTYVLAHFWRNQGAFQRGDDPHIIEEFLMNLKPIRKQAVLDNRGYVQRESGMWASPIAPSNPNDPIITEDINIDVAGQIEDNIKQFILTIVKQKIGNGNFTGDRLSPTTADPYSILVRQDIQNLKGKSVEHTP